MRRTGLTKETLVGYITQAFFELLEKKPFNQLSVIEIVSLAGVSRSTYYRYFTCKEDIVKSFTKDVIQDCIAAYNKSEKAHSGDDTLQRQTWLLILFSVLKRYKQEILLLKRNSLTGLFLDALNESFVIPDSFSKTDEYRLRYHLGGLFNCFMLWIDEGIDKNPQVTVSMIMDVLPKDYIPIMPLLNSSFR